MGGKSKQKTEQNQTQQTTLTQPYQSLSDQILRNATAVQQQPQVQANQTKTNELIGGGLAELQKTIAGQYLTPESNPTLAALVESQQVKAQDALGKNLTTIGDVSQRAGAYGGSRQGVIEGTAHAQFAKDALDSANQIYYGNYAAERENQMNAAGTLQQYLAAQNVNNNAQNNNLAQLLAILAPYNSATTGNMSGYTTVTANPVDQAIKLAAIFNQG